MNRNVLMIAEQIREKCTDAMMDWGKAVVAAEADKGNVELTQKAKVAGLKVQTFAVIMAKRFG